MLLLCMFDIIFILDKFKTSFTIIAASDIIYLFFIMNLLGLIYSLFTPSYEDEINSLLCILSIFSLKQFVGCSLVMQDGV